MHTLVVSIILCILGTVHITRVYDIILLLCNTLCIVVCIALGYAY